MSRVHRSCMQTVKALIRLHRWHADLRLCLQNMTNNMIFCDMTWTPRSTFIHFTVCCMLPCRHWAPNQTYGRILNTETLPQLLRHNLNMIKMWKLYNTPNISQDYGRILNKEALPQFLRHNQIMTKMWKLGNTPNTSQAPHALSTSFDQPRMTRVSVGCPHHMVHFCEKMLIYWEQDS